MTKNDYEFTMKVLNDIPDVRIDKVNELKEKINKGYCISNEELSEKIIKSSKIK